MPQSLAINAALFRATVAEVTLPSRSAAAARSVISRTRSARGGHAGRGRATSGNRFAIWLTSMSLPFDDDAVQRVVEGEAAGLRGERGRVEWLDLESGVERPEAVVPGAGLVRDVRGAGFGVRAVADDAELVQAGAIGGLLRVGAPGEVGERATLEDRGQIGRASCRERGEDGGGRRPVKRRRVVGERNEV